MTHAVKVTETTIPLMPCRSLDDLLPFYQTLGFETTFVQTSPYLYASVQRGGIELHFSDFRGFSQKTGFASCLVMVAEIAPYHWTFSDALRTKYGRVPTGGLPRISRLREGLDRFGLFDPAGNWLIFLQSPEQGDEEWQVGQVSEEQSALQTAIDMATLFRDYKGNDDVVAAKILDVALAREKSASPIDRALALAARAEIAVALGDTERLNVLRTDIYHLPLSEEERERHRPEFEAADELERWINAPTGAAG